MNLKLKVWRQKNSKAAGKFVEYDAPNIPEHCSFLEMLDIVNEGLSQKNQEPIAFDHDCREGICGMCSLVINGIPHGPNRATTTCQLHMRYFKDGDTITIEPFRATPFPVIKDLVVARSALDRIQQAGGFITARAGSAPDGNSVAIPKVDADLANRQRRGGVSPEDLHDSPLKFTEPHAVSVSPRVMAMVTHAREPLAVYPLQFVVSMYYG